MATLAALCALGLSSAPPASAHDELIASDPPAASQLDSAPATITLSFNNPPLPIGATVIVVDADGTDWIDGAPSAVGTSLVSTLRSGMHDGNYQVRWRVVSADGAVVSGFYGFSVGDSAAAPAVPTPRRAEPAGDRSELGDFALTPAGAPGDPGDAGHADPGGSPARTALIGVTGALAGVGLFVLGTLLFRSDRRRRQAESNRSSTPVPEPADVPGKDAAP